MVSQPSSGPECQTTLEHTNAEQELVGFSHQSEKEISKQSQTHEEQHTKTYQGQELRLTASCCTRPPHRMDLRQLHCERWRPRTLSFALQLQRTKGLRCPHAAQTLDFNREHKEPRKIRRRTRRPPHSQNIMTQFAE